MNLQTFVKASNDELIGTDYKYIVPNINGDEIKRSGGIMQTYRVKLNTVCDEEVLAKNKEEAIEIAKKQLENKMYTVDINFVDINSAKAIDATTANKVRRI